MTLLKSLPFFLFLSMALTGLPSRSEEAAASYFQKGLEAIRRKLFTEAEAEIKMGLKLDPASPVGYDLLGIAYDGLGNSQEAEKAFRQAIKLNPKFVAAHNDLGRSLYKRGLAQPAEEEFRQALVIDPRNFTASFNLGLLARDAKRYPQSVEHLEKALQVLPSDVSTLFALSGAYLGAGQKDRAFSVASRLVALDPGNPQIRFSLGTLFLEWKQYEAAAEHLARARLSEPKNFELLHNLGQAYNHLKRYSEAEDAFLRALELSSDSVETMYQLAVVYSESSHPDQAIQVLVRARQLAPKRPDILLLLGRECIQEGFVDDAIEVLQDCAKLDTGKVEPHLLLGEAYTQKKRFAEAQKSYQTLVALEPSNPQGFVLLGRTFRYLGQYADAERVLHQALKLNAGDSQALYYLGLVSSDRVDYQGARSFFEKALQSNPDFLAALYDMAVNCMRLNDDKSAREYLERARVVAPTFAQVYYRLALVYQRLKLPDQATEARALFKKYELLETEKRDFFPYGVLEFVQQTQDLPLAQRLERYRQELLKTEKLKPDDLNLLFMLVQIDFRLGLKEEALRRLEKISTLQQNNLEVHLRAASLLTAFSCYPQALQELRALVQNHPDSQQARFALASLYLQMRRPDEALQVLSFEDRTAVQTPAYHHLLGRILTQKGKGSEALEHFGKALEMEPANEQYLADLASELTVAGETRKAAQILHRAKAKFPSSGRVRFAEGIWYQLTGHESDALAAFKQAADFSWEWEAPHLAQANLLLQTGSIAESQDVSEQTATLFPNSPWPHWLKGLAILKNQGGALTQSPEEIKQSVRLAAGRQEALPILLLSSLKHQDCGTAQVVWNTMIKSGWTPEIDPKNWCASEKDSASARFTLPANMDNPPANLRWLIDLAQSTLH